ncbi:hypothetical protein ACWFMI_20905 [Nocardiopsis terrae]
MADTGHAGHGALPRRRRPAEHTCADDGRPLLRPYTLHGEQVSEAVMVWRRARADEHRRALEVLGQISVQQVCASADLHLQALTSSLAADAAPDDLSELACAIKRLVRIRPELAHTSDTSFRPSWNPSHFRHTQ